MSIRSVLSVVVGLVVVLRATAATAADPVPGALVEQPAYTTIELSNVDATQHLVVPLTPKAGVEGLTASVRAVTAADRVRPGLTGELEAAVSADGRELSIDVTYARVREARTYTLAIELSGTVAAADGKRAAAQQLLTVQLVLPPARLRAVANLVITDVRWCPWCDADVSRTITLAELSRATRLTGFAVRQVDPPVKGGVQVDSGFTATAVDGQALPGTLGAGADVVVRLSWTGLPTGTSTGQITVTADQLEQPMMIAYEIRTRVTTFYIVLVFIVVGLIGWFVRHKLKEVEAERALRSQVEPLLAAARREARSNPVAAHRRALPLAVATVDQALAGREVAAVQKASDDLRAAVEAAFAARAAFRTQLFADLDALKRAIANRWDLPAALPDVGPALGRSEAALLADNPREAEAEMGPIERAFDAVGAASNTWLIAARQASTSFTSDDGGLARFPAVFRPLVNPLIEEARARVAAVPVYDPTHRPKPGDFLPAIHAARRATRALIETVAPAFAETARKTLEALAAVEAQPELVASVRAAATVEPLPEDPSTALQRVDEGLRAFAAAVAVFVTKDEARLLLTAGDYAGAVLEQHALATGIDAGKKISAGGGVVQRDAMARVGRRPAADAPPPGPVRVVIPERVDPVVVARRELRQIKIVRGLASLGVLSLAAWAVFRGSWQGTEEDFIKVAATAFFTDFTLDAVVEAVTKLRPPAPS